MEPNKYSKVPKRIWVMPEYGKPWAGTVLRTYNNNTVAIVNPDLQPQDETRKVDLEYTAWASLDKE